jgi:uridylate kinase
MKKIVISLGGSIVAPEKGPDGKFVLQFAKTIKKLAQNRQFFIVVGGGIVARSYVKAAKLAGVKEAAALDFVGIKATQLNAQFVKTIFSTVISSQLLDSLTQPLKKARVVVCGGFNTPGQSTDYIAVQIAKIVKAKNIVNLSNINYVFDKNPVNNRNAKHFPRLTWKKYLKVVGTKWKPGLNAPFDPVASKKAEQLGIEAVIANGRDLSNFKRIVEGKVFIGTRIK